MMKKGNVQKSKELDVLTPMVVVLGAIIILISGYQTGQWIFEVLH